MLLFDRHVEKNGGSGFRASMKASECTLVSYGVYESSWRRIDTMLANNQSVCVEAHSPVNPRHWQNTLLALQDKHPHVRIVKVFRVREPASFYKSFYQWGVSHKHEFLKWMPYDIQANTLQRSHNAVLAQHGAPLTKISKATCEDILWNVTHFFDFVYALEQHNQVLPAIRRATGMKLPLTHVSPRRKWWIPTNASFAYESDEIIRNRTLVVAECDWRLYRTALRSGGRILASSSSARFGGKASATRRADGGAQGAGAAQALGRRAQRKLRGA